MKNFVTIDNVPFDWEKRLHELDDYTLFVSDCFWMLKTEVYCEFYYNPCQFIGKIALIEMPDCVQQRISRCSAIFKKGEIHYGALSQSKQGVWYNTTVRFRQLERDMRIGNWFHAQGQNYVTWKGKLICDDMYVEGCERECSIHDINGGIVYDLIRMRCQSRTPTYIKSVFDLSVFDGVDVSKITVLPYEDTEWDAAQWVEKFKYYSEEVAKYNNVWDMQHIRNLRAEVFRHTVAVVKRGYYTLDGKEYAFVQEDTQSMIKGSCYYDKPFNVCSYPTQGDETIISVENSDCLTVAKGLQYKGYNVAVLNMASRQNPGGGVLGGAGAQEENIFRRTNLFLSMFQFAGYANQYGLDKHQKQYPLDREYGGIYTPNAMVFRGEEKDGYPMLGADSFHMSFIAVPGINRPDLRDDTHLADNMIEGTKNKIRTILRIGLRHGHDSLVLGALGCGAFCNPPSHIARLFHEVFEESEFKNKYCLISFAILDDHNSHRSHNPEGNYLPFVKEFHPEHKLNQTKSLC